MTSSYGFEKVILNRGVMSFAGGEYLINGSVNVKIGEGCEDGEAKRVRDFFE